MNYRFGSGAAALRDQLKLAGLNLSRAESARLKPFQEDADQILRLRLRGLITDSVALRARRRLVVWLERAVFDRRFSGKPEVESTL